MLSSQGHWLVERSLHTVRPFADTDIDDAVALWRRTPGVGLSTADEPPALRRYLARNAGLSFVATAGGELVGTILCGHDGRRGLIHHLAVAPSHRRIGVARALLISALAALTAEGIQKCHALVMHDNTGGIAFWRAVRAVERDDLLLFSVLTTDGT